MKICFGLYYNIYDKSVKIESQVFLIHRFWLKPRFTKTINKVMF